MGSRRLAMTAVLSVVLSSGSGCISSDSTSHHGTSMITLLPTSSCSGFYSHAPEVPRVLHERVIGRYIVFRGTFLLMSYIRAVVSHCPISMCEKNVVAQTRTGVFLASLNIAGVGSSRYDIDIMAISWECALYNRRTRRSMYSAIIHNCCICVSNLKGCLDKQHVRIIRCLTELFIDSAMQRANEHDYKSLFVGSVG